MRAEEWWSYVREDKIGLTMLVLTVVAIIAAVATGHLP